jgi:hypothetical protein
VVITAPAIDDLPDGLAWIMMFAATNIDRGQYGPPGGRGRNERTGVQSFIKGWPPRLTHPSYHREISRTYAFNRVSPCTIESDG